MLNSNNKKFLFQNEYFKIKIKKEYIIVKFFVSKKIILEEINKLSNMEDNQLTDHFLIEYDNFEIKNSCLEYLSYFISILNIIILFIGIISSISLFEIASFIFIPHSKF